jgi:hypothetical protein
MLVPGGGIAKFDDFGGTKSPFAREIRPAMRRDKPVKTADQTLYGPQSLL